MTAQAWLDTIRSKRASVTVDGEGRIVIEPDVLTDDELTDDEATELAGAAGGGGGERATLEVTSACGPICGPPSWPIGKADRSGFQ
jgi:hypothetical protein